MNQDLQRERANATFSVERITNMLDGGKHRTERRRFLEKVIASDPSGVFSNDDVNYLHRTERHIRAMAKHVRMVEICRKLGIGNECDGQIVLSEDFPVVLEALGEDLPTALHWVMFVPNILTLCDDEQQAEWLPLIRDWKMIGCYAQTELGHGSNVRALETTATFLPESKGGQSGGSWIINSPTLTSAKFWPGTLGRTANHAMVIARLIDGNGVDHGIHNFLVQLRSMEDHSLLKGVETGDIGPKIGYNVMDNGFARFNNVVIPRRNMAMRFAEVDENGVYRKKTVSDAAAKVAYITMMQVRAMIVFGSGRDLGKACTVVIRYSAVRRQGYDAGEESELQVLDYKQQQHRIFPLLAQSYCTFFTSKVVSDRLKNIEMRLINGEPMHKVEIADIHASSSALKSFCTMTAADGIEECRKACGGQGFLACSGLPDLFTTYLQNPTVEGDNHMLPQQVIKVLMKLVQAIHARSDISMYKPCASYALVPSLKNIIGGEHEKCEAEKASDLMELDVLILAFRHRSARLLVEVTKQIQTHVMNGKTPQEAWNLSLVAMACTSRAYSLFLLVQNFAVGIKDKVADNSIGDNEAKVLTDLARLYALYWMEKEVGDFVVDGYISTKHVAWIKSNVLECLDTIRPNAVALVDARDVSDFRLKSALGRYDGDVYPHIMAAAKKDPLNAIDPGPAYDPELKRLIVGGVGKYSGTAARL